MKPRYPIPLLLMVVYGIFLPAASIVVAQPFSMNPEEAAITRSGGITDNDSLIVIGQTAGGRAKSLLWSIDVGIIACYFFPPPGTNVFWNAADGPYNIADNWLPEVVPDNTQTDLYNVFITDSDDVVTLNFNPSISELHVGTASVSTSRLEVNAQPSVGSSRGILFEEGATINATNHGKIRVISGAAARTMQLTFMKLVQAATGVLEADGQTTMARLQLVDSRVTGGVLRSVGTFATIQLRDSELVDIQIEGAEVESGYSAVVQGNIANEGDILLAGTVGQPARLEPAETSATLQGKSGRVVLTSELGSKLGSEEQQGVLINAEDHKIVGQGSIVGPVINDGIIQADDPSGSLRIQAEVTGTGELIVEEAGKLLIEPGSTQTNVTADKLTVRAATLPNPASTAEVTGDSVLRVNELIMQGGDSLLRGYTPPILRILGTSGVLVTSNVRFETDSPYALTSDGRMSIGGDFVNHSTDRFNFDAAGTILLDGSTPQNFEMAGEDYGIGNPNSYINNFSVGTLRIESGATVDFVNEFENLNMGPVCEVLYVQRLEIAAGATLRLGDCNVYYQTLVNEGGTVQLLGDGLLLSASVAGDLNGDGVRDHLDAMILASVLVGTDTNPNHVAAADMNGDQVLDAKDIQVFLNVLFP